MALGAVNLGVGVRRNDMLPSVVSYQKKMTKVMMKTKMQYPHDNIAHALCVHGAVYIYLQMQHKRPCTQRRSAWQVFVEGLHRSLRIPSERIGGAPQISISSAAGRITTRTCLYPTTITCTFWIFSSECLLGDRFLQ